MRYVGTRGGGSAGFRAVVTGGLAPGGGLWMPEVWPHFSHHELSAMARLDYAETAARVLARFIGDDIDDATLLGLCRDAYAGFDDAAVTPLRRLDDGLSLLELFHGPTLSFKDIALQLLGAMLGHFGARTTIIGATSGDTGSAAIHAVAGKKGVRIVMLYPEGRISDVQRRQMTSVAAGNVDVVAIDGSFDDCQRIVKALLGDAALVAKHRLSAVNSINWLRIAAQSVYYFTAALRLGAPDSAVGFAVPTGNLGDAFAGHAARRMGLPIARIIVATNANDIVARALADGVYRPGAVRATDAPAMDIQVASNFERLLWDAAGGDGAVVARQMAALAGEGEIVLTDAQRAALAHMTGVAIDAAAMDAAMRWADERGTTIDPHTAIALAAAQSVGGDDPIAVVATAHPAKFPDAVRRATGRDPTVPARLADALTGAERVVRLPADVAAVTAYVAARG
ncbi:threonine synthase [Sphingorhabdus soli]|uniref:Threonine synthase n=1 Tax=Flavisphingopyxis soli TaxID=2601267 RepID=A0A5C6UP34_9SPHN|nr:threonine synthase [Sphingorhabdus soli]TXC73901.1 threonine synthase [Sphingorhabdus soli]